MTNYMPPSDLQGQTLRFSAPLGPRKLDKVLGGGENKMGSTSWVFLGVDPQNPGEESKRVAVKVSNPDPMSRDSLEAEWRCLSTLARWDSTTHYFPRVLHPAAAEGLDMQPSLPGLPPQATWRIIVQELVRGDSADDLLLRFPGLVLPEPLALAMWAQYADMLGILHNAGMTCGWDRKPSDLRWVHHPALEFDPEKPGYAATYQKELLSHLRQSWEPGRLMVLDWNKVRAKTDENVAADLVKTGLLWCELLLASKPSFQTLEGGGFKQLEEPLSAQSRWSTLSAGTRAILERALHPLPQSRFGSANELRNAVRQQITRWQMTPQALWDSVQRTDLDPSEAYLRADLLRLLIESWGADRRADLDRKLSSLKPGIDQASWGPLHRAMDLSNWAEADQELARLWATNQGDVPIALWLNRCRAIVARATQLKALSTEIKALHDYANYTEPPWEWSGGEQRRAETLVTQWKDSGWQSLAQMLTAERIYPALLHKARELKGRGNMREALPIYKRVSDRRNTLAHPDYGDALRLLDQLYADPEPEMRSLRDWQGTLEKINDYLGLAVEALISDVDSDLSDIQRNLAGAQRVDPRNPALSLLCALLKAESEWRQAKGGFLSSRIVRLGALDRAWRSRAVAPQPAEPKPASAQDGGAQGQALVWEECERLVGAKAGQIGALLRNRWVGLQDELVRRLIAAPTAAAQVADGPLSAELSHETLLRCYLAECPDEKAADQIMAALRDRASEFQRAVRDALESPKQGSVGTIKDRENRLAGIIRVAEHGKMLAGLANQEWPVDLEPAKIEQAMKETRGCLMAIAEGLGVYREGA
ncbi:MAG: hypothetical protein GXY76_22695 [Chloroflexi bacterium]|nr:hypothetical protein [Chloroflexota bacterium]